jgi:protein TonB
VRLNSSLTRPTVVREVKPRYHAEAMARKVQGVALLKPIILTDGTVGPVCVAKSLDPELDLQAIAAAREWRFQPATLTGGAVPVIVTIELKFTLRD